MKAALNQILKSDQSAPPIFRYKSPADFNALWKACASDQQARLLPGPIIIVWDSTPSDESLDPIRCENVLSPIDWAIAYIAKHKGEPWPNILILDLQPDTNKSARLYRQFLQMGATSFPWLHVHAAPQISLVDILKFIKSDNGEAANAATQADAIDAEAGHRKKAKRIEAHESLLRNARLNLIEDGSNAETDRHAIANIVGPMLLRGGRLATKHATSSHAPALKKLLEACELIGAMPSATPDKIDITGLNLVLLDDQAEHGWEDWLREVTSGGTLEVITSPVPLIEALKNALELGGEEKKDLRFRYDPGTKTPAASHPVVLLDIRLFSGDAAGEQAFLESQLLPLIENHFVREKLAWPAFRRDELISKSVKDLQRLTWLPRVLALADMSLPIILFSSTGRRDLVEPFKDYGNVVTLFEKPRLTEFAAADCKPQGAGAVTISAFKAAIGKARDWLRFRDVISGSMTPNLGTLISTPRGEAVTHFEIYFDESGSSRMDGFRVGALTVGYRDSTHADDLAKRMHDAGISWFNECGQTFIYNKRESRDPHVVSQWSCRFAPYLAEVWTLPMVLWADPADKQVASDTFNADTLLQSLVAELLEINLFVLLPTRSVHTFAIYGAQRRIGIPGTEFPISVPLPSGISSSSVSERWLQDNNIPIPTGVREAVQKCLQRWAVDQSCVNYEINNALGRATFLSIQSAQDYGGIVARCFQTRPWDDPWKTQSERIVFRFSPLNHEEKASLCRQDRPMHIVADFLPGDTTWDQAHGPTLNAARTFFRVDGASRPILLAEGAELSRLLGLCRAVDGEDYSTALANAVALSRSFHTHAEFLYLRALQKLPEAADKIHGTNLTGASHYLEVLRGSDANADATRGGLTASASRQPTAALPFSRVHIRHQHWTEYPLPNPNETASLEAYCDSKLLVDFQIPPHKVEKNVGCWALTDAVAAEYLGVSITAVEWIHDLPTKSLLALATTTNRSGVLPFRRFTIDVPAALRLDRLTQPLTIRASAGPLPIARLRMSSHGNIEWVQASPVQLTDRGWTYKQILAVINPPFEKLGPLHPGDLSRVVAAIGGVVPRWVRNTDGNFMIFLPQNDIAAAATALKRPLPVQQLLPQDFDSNGILVHVKPGWPNVPPAKSANRPSSRRRQRGRREKWRT